jgi:hypothetical protein
MHAHLINRGEQFEAYIGKKRFTGQCAWSRNEITPIYPVTLFPGSIKRDSIFFPFLSSKISLKIAVIACRKLKSMDPAPSAEYITEPQNT